MKKVSLDTWIQLLGMFSVVAGLVFVGLEMRTNCTCSSTTSKDGSFLDAVGIMSDGGVVTKIFFQME